MELTHLSREQVRVDEGFNSRGELGVMDVQDLAHDIEQNGLLQPIVVEPWEGEDYDFNLIAGFRRMKAWFIVHTDPVPAVLQEPMSKDEARVKNLCENIKRSNLNLVQEAKAIEPFLKAGMTQREVGKKVGMTKGWVQVRQNILALPKDVQDEVALGILTTQQIRQLYAVRAYPDTLRELFKTMKEGKKQGKTVRVKRKKAMSSRAKRNTEEMSRMIEHMAEAEFGIHTRALAWAAGTISTDELLDSFDEYCDENGLEAPPRPDRF